MFLKDSKIVISLIKICSIAVITAGFYSCDGDSSQRSQLDTTKWEYNIDEDKMTSEKSYSATIGSEKNLYLNYASRRPVFPEITISKNNQGTTVSVSVSSLTGSNYNGVFTSHNNQATLEVKFDEGKTIKFNGTTPAGDDKYYVIINSPKRFISKLKKSKKVLVRATFTIAEPTIIEEPIRISKYHAKRSKLIEGKHSYRQEIMEFPTAGLKWEH